MFRHRVAQEEIAEQLIAHLLGFKPGEANFDRSLQFVCSNLYHHKCLSPEPRDLRKQMDGVLLKLYIHGLGAVRDSLQCLMDKWISRDLSADEESVRWSILSLMLQLSHNPTNPELALLPSPLQHQAPNVLESTELASQRDEDNIIKQLLNERASLNHLSGDGSADDELSDWSSEEQDIDAAPSVRVLASDTSLHIHRAQRRSERKSRGGGNELSSSDDAAGNGCGHVGEPIVVDMTPTALQRKASYAKHWLAANTSQYTLSVDGVRVVSEAALVKELLNVLVFPNNTAPVITNPPATPTLPQASIASIVSSCVQPAVEALCSFRLPWLGSEELLGMGYSTALHSWHQQFCSDILQLQNRDSEEPVTVLWLIESLEDALSDVEVLESVHNTVLHSTDSVRLQQIRLVSALCDAIDSSVSTQQRSLLLQFLLHTLLPLLDALQQEVFTLPSIIHRNPDVDVKTETFWNTAYEDSNADKLCEIRGSSSFLPTLSLISKLFKHKELLSALQADVSANIHLLSSSQKVQLQQILHIEGTPLMASILSKLEELCGQNESGTTATAAPTSEQHFTAKHFQSRVESMEVPSLVTVRAIMSTIHSALEEYSQPISRSLSELLYTHYSMGSYVSSLCSAAFLQPANVMAGFTAAVFDKVTAGQRLNAAELTLDLQECVERLHPGGMSKNISVTVEGSVKTNETEGNEEEHLHDSLDEEEDESTVEDEPPYSMDMTDLRLVCDVSWPLSCIPGSSHMELYNRVLQFSLRLQQAVYVLNSISFRDMSGWELVRSRRGTHDDLRWRLHRLRLLRHWLLYFSYTVHQHFTASVLLPFFGRLNSLIDRKPPLDEFLEEYKSELKSLCQRCLISTSAMESPVQVALKQVVSVVRQVCGAWRCGGCDSDTITRMEDSYAACHRFLLRLLSALLSRGSPAHLHLSGLIEELEASCPMSA